MTSDDKTTPSQDWNRLAQEALDLWQNHLNNLANDPKVKEDMARMVAPMGQMFTQWASLMQTGMQNMSPDAAAQEDAPAQHEAQEMPPRAQHEPEQAASAPPAAPVMTQPSVDQPSINATNDPTAPSPVATEPALQPAARGRAAPADGSRDLAQLASRLAELERELDGLRPRTKRAGSDTAESASDASDAGDVQRMAGSGQGTASR